MAESNVCTMMYGAVQALAFHVGAATVAAEQARWFPALVALTRALGALHEASPLVRGVTHALVLTPGADDMLQVCVWLCVCVCVCHRRTRRSTAHA